MKRILSVLLTVALLFSSVPMVVMADMPNDFQANFNVDALDGKWNTKEDGSGDSCDTVRLDFQVKGTNVSRNQGAWIAIDLTQLVWVDYTEDGYTIFDSENITIVPGATAVKFFEGDEPYYYDLKDPVKSGRNTVDMWSIGETAPILVAVSADSNTMYLCPQPSQSYEVTYETLTTIVSFRLAVCPGVELSSDAIRFINAEEREHLNQSFIVLMADKTNMFGYGFAPDKETGVTPADTLAIPSAFTGTAGVTGKPTVKPVDAVKPVIDVDPAGASYIVGTAATPLTVSATVTDGGTLTYEWFKNDTNSTENGTSVGTGAAYTPATDVIGETYYYVVVTNTNETATGAKTASVTGDAVKITVTADPDLEALAAAKQTLETTGIGSVNQKDCPSEDDIKAYIVSQLRGLVPGFELTVNTVKYTPSVPGTSAVPMGTNGEYQYTVTIEKNGKTTTTAELKADVLAVAYEGITDEQAIAAAEAALKAITWSEIAQAVANTQDTVQAKLLEQAKAAINNDRVTVTVEVTAFTAAVAGSAATTKEGTNGSATFTVTATIGDEEYKLENQSVVIKATAFDGKLDVEVIAEAEAALKAITWAEIAQAVANTQDTVQAKLLEQAKAAVNNANVTVTVDVTAFTAAVAGSAATTKEGTNGSAAFTVTATIGSEEYKLENQSVVIKATAFDGKLDVEVIAEAEAALKAATWAEIAQAVANTQDTVQAKLLEQAKAAINNDRVTVTVEVTAFTAAVAGSAATTKEGTNGSATFTVTATIGDEEYKLENQSVVIKATAFDGKLDVEVIAEAEAALKAITWAEIAQAVANTQDTVQAKLLEQAKAAINNDRVTVTVEVTAFTAAVAGSAATTKEGINGSATFTVIATIGDEEYKLENQNVVIKATAFDGKLDSEVIAEAEAALKAATWAEIAQAVANTQDTVQAKLLEQAKAAINNDRVTVTVEVTAFTAAVAGSAATTKEGTNGSAAFTVTVTIGDEEYKLENQSVVIKATAFDGKLDSEVIAEAEAVLKAITWAEIAQAVANTQDTVQAKLLEQAKAAINNDRVTVTVEVTAFTAAVAGSAATTKEGTNGSATFTVTATIGDEEYKLENQSVVIKATAFDGKLDSEVIAEAEAALKAATWAEIAQAVANTQDTVQAKLLEQAKAAINNDRVTVTVEVTAFTAAVAGSAATTKEGINGSATFTVIATIGDEEYKLENQNVVIKATAFDGVLDVDAVEAAKKALVNSKVIVKIGATASEIRTAVENYLKSLMKGDAKGVTVTITAVDGDQYTVALAKGSVTAEKTITITVEEEDPIKLREPANLQFTDGVAIWTPVENAVSYTVSLYEVVDGVETLITTVAALNSQCDFSEILEEGKSYVFDVIAHGDGVYFLDSDVSDFSAVYTEGNTWEQILVVLLAIRNSKYPITATAGEGGAITDAGVTKVKYGRDMTYYIAAEPGYEIDQVIVDGKDVGPVSEYTFTDVKKKHTISVTFKAAAWKNPFKDVSEGDPFCDAVQFVYENKLFQGISDTEFAPAMTMTRAMFITVLWRLEGMPVVNYLMQYEDVEADTWYTEAIRWATAEGIVEGYGDGIFGTNDPVTVQQSAVIMARYAEYTGNYTAPGANLGIYADNADVADWAVEAMMWAVENGVYAPVNGKLVPTALAPRSLAAQLMHAYVVKFGK